MIVRSVFLGPPGAGKGTQAQLLAEHYDVRQISTGDILRRHVREGSELGRRAEPLMRLGQLVPDDLVVAMIADDLAGSFVLDGFPRTVGQAEALDAMLDAGGRPLDVVVLFEAERATLVERLTGRWSNPRTGRTYHATFAPPRTPGIDDDDGGPLVQRPDDRLEVVIDRLETYERETLPLVDHYGRRGVVRRVDALAPVAEVTAKLVGLLGLAHGVNA